MSGIINIQEALTKAKKDDKAGISIASLSTGDDFFLFSAEIQKGHKVGCHYHTEGDEIYSVLSGEGMIYTATIDDMGDLDDICFRPVVAGDSFTIPSGTAHQLKASSDMVLLFVCSPSHLSSDRIMMPSLTS